MHRDRDEKTNPIDAFVLERIHYRVNELISHGGYTESDREDLQQELIVGVLEAMQNNFDPSQSSRETFIRNVLDRRCIDLMRYQQAQGRACSRNGFSLDDDADHEPEEAAERTRRGADGISEIERADVRMDLAASLAGLSQRRQMVCRMFAELSPPEIAERLNISRRTVYRDLERVREAVQHSDRGRKSPTRGNESAAITNEADSEPSHFASGAAMPATTPHSILDHLVREPAQVYHAKAKEHLSSHALADFRRCPLLYRRKQLGLIDDKDSPAYRVGRAAHTLVLEGRARFDAEYVVGGPVNEKTGKPYGANTKAFSEWAAAQQREVLTDEQAALVERMAASVADHDEAQALLATGVAEGVVRVTYLELSCQIRIDWLNPDAGIVDFKTCDDLDWLEADGRRFGYVHQLAFYRRVLAIGADVAVTDLPVHIVAAEKKEPFRVGVWRLGQDVLAIAQQENEAAMGRLKRCIATDTWPTGYEQPRLFDHL